MQAALKPKRTWLGEKIHAFRKKRRAKMLAKTNQKFGWNLTEKQLFGDEI